MKKKSKSCNCKCSSKRGRFNEEAYEYSLKQEKAIREETEKQRKHNELVRELNRQAELKRQKEWEIFQNKIDEEQRLDDIRRKLGKELQAKIDERNRLIRK